VRNAGARGTVGPVRAREPDRSGFAVREGVRLYYEVHGDGPATVVLLPPWSIVHARTWKAQVPYLARHARVVVYDARGNGRSDRPSLPSAYDDAELVADALAVMDMVGVPDAVVVGLSTGARVLLALASEHPGRVRGAVFVGAAVALPGTAPIPDVYARLADLPTFADGFFRAVFPEPHSTRHVEDGVAWALETDAATLMATQSPDRVVLGPADAVAATTRVRCPALVVHGDDDLIVPVANGLTLARALGCPVDVVTGGGHCVQARHPVWFNVRLRRFVEEVDARARA
jgi:pimeloyl-ACP methyl ester carboxylesterase